LGNKDGGITTLEEKSLGCTQKAGRATVIDALGYLEPVKERGLSLVYGPGYDLVSCTTLAASGAHMVLFTTGRGTPYGGPVPTMKLATNTPLAQLKHRWIDFNAGSLIEDGAMEKLTDDLLELVIGTANGAPTKSEQKGYRELAIFKTGAIV